MKTTVLRNVLASIEDIDDEATIYAQQPWRPDSATAIARMDEEASEATARGLAYFLEVAIVREAVEVWGTWREGRQPTPDERCEAAIHYAVNDAFLPP